MRRIVGEEVKESVFQVEDKDYEKRDFGVKSVAQEYEEEQEEYKRLGDPRWGGEVSGGSE